MAKGDQEETMQAIRQQRTASSKRTADYLAGNAANIGNEGTPGPGGDMQGGTGIRGRIGQQRTDLLGRLSSYAGTGGVSDATQTALGRGPNSITGSLTAPNYAPSISGYQDIAATGGADLGKATSTYRDIQGGSPDVASAATGLRNIDFSGVNQNIGSLNQLAATGGMSEADKANVLRPLYYETEKTGGYTPEQIANIKSESNASVPGFYANLQDEMNRRQATSGYGPGFSAAAQSAARQGAIGAGQQALNTDVGLAESVRQGKLSAADAIQRGQLGISGITSQTSLGALRTAGEEGLGITGQRASNLEASGRLSQSEQSLRLAAAQGDVDAQRILQSGKLAGLGGMTDIATAQGQYGLNRAGLESGNVRSAAEMTQQGQQYGLSGLGGMYQSELGQLSNEQRNQLAAMGLDDDQQAQLLNIMSRTATAPGRNQQLFNNILGGAGAVSGGLSGLGSFNNSAFRRQPIPGTNGGF